ncbi:MAG: ATP-dependent DNA helicase RecG [Ruminococcaceae bacterium]|nr:ATP-dependent DNA helicase RecG [Oscillospiraceae bacterium]
MGKHLKSSVSVLSGIGETRKKAFEKIGIETLKDLLYHIPRAYQNRGNVKQLKDALDGEIAAFSLCIVSPPKNAILKNRLTLTKLRASDESGTVDVVFFNQPFLKDVFTLGAEFRFWGKLTYQNKKWQLISPEFESIIPGKLLPDFIPVYHLTEGLSGKQISKAVSQALSLCLPEIEDSLPQEIRKKNALPTLSFSLQNIHFPESAESLNRAINRLAYEELFYFSLGLHIIKKNQAVTKAIPCQTHSLKPLLSLLEYELTAAQKRVVNEIISDMTSRENKLSPMNRILIGDVGSGKTICAACAIYTAVKSDLQSAFLVPTEVLARQHYNDLSELFAGLGIKTALLLGSTSASEKKKIYSSLSSDGQDRIDLIIGTHALLNEKVSFSNLGLLITDEQHRFGVKQRAVLKERNEGVHTLVMSATPIPRTLAFALYGDLDISCIDEMPVGRQRVDTFLVDESYRTRLNAFIRRQIEEGGQVYIICPSIEEENDNSEIPINELTKAPTRSTEDKLKNVIEYEKNLQEEVFPDLKTAFLHGRLKPSEKESIMKSFADGDINILVSTTVIEVGINVPNASLMIIENSERFGLSQLHQLRGRVGRGNRKSYCILVSDSKGAVAKSRLEIMKNTYDGYKIAEKDLELRGPGDFFASLCDSSIRQSGGLSLRFSSLCTSAELMKNAFEDANSIIKSDPFLLKEEHKALSKEIDHLFNLNENTIS